MVWNKIKEYITYKIQQKRREKVDMKMKMIEEEDEEKEDDR